MKKMMTMTMTMILYKVQCDNGVDDNDDKENKAFNNDEKRVITMKILKVVMKTTTISP